MGAAKKLAANVWVGERLFLAGDSPEKEYAEQITNPKAWASSSSSDDEVTEPAEVVVTGGDDAGVAPEPPTAKKTAAKRSQK